ncbi:MAG TPA: hypothetical protein V6D48_06960 [Oculatellaceae cyanobacterium]
MQIYSSEGRSSSCRPNHLQDWSQTLNDHTSAGRSPQGVLSIKRSLIHNSSRLQTLQGKSRILSSGISWWY